ncbi:MAG: bifunctional ornithine acetyltransferase/N-acetylglutamate synthase, partial [Chloroflexi bacterium]|nr:bifunctional ornithine acetyltransferase/N-acetylglutamate synthase [Chloroflexota bacterium]
MSQQNTGVTAAKGFRASGVACGLKKTGALDLAMITSDTDCACAGVFTTNRVQAAPVLYAKETLGKNPGAIRAVVINSGCANACTGDAGLNDTRETARSVASALGCRADQVLVLSTGVIGVRLDVAKVREGIAKGAQALSYEGGSDASKAIMTTDTRQKQSVLRNTDYV